MWKHLISTSQLQYKALASIYVQNGLLIICWDIKYYVKSLTQCVQYKSVESEYWNLSMIFSHTVMNLKGTT